jgi:phospholipid/cholesterol/gamma-HCH transport system permease protein
LYRFSALTAGTLVQLPLAVKNPGILFQQMYQIGIQSIPLVAITAVFLGAETVVQAEYQLRNLVPLRFLGVLVCKSTINELGPVVTSMVVSGRVATAIAAEIGSMKTTEQLDAMTILNLDPIRYIVVPKTLACIFMLPVLVIFSIFLAILGSIATVFFSIDVTVHAYLESLRFLFYPMDLFLGVAKTAVFGLIIATVGAYYGYQARGGAQGVGNSTTKAVMTCAALILIVDSIIAAIVY